MELTEKLTRFFSAKLGGGAPEGLNCYDSMLRIIEENKDLVVTFYNAGRRYVQISIPPNSVLMEKRVEYTPEFRQAAVDICKLHPAFESVIIPVMYRDVIQIGFQRDQ